jgi:hypothetical protein
VLVLVLGCMLILTFELVCVERLQGLGLIGAV